MAEETSKKFHMVMFPWFATGHMTPFLHLSNELASRGHKITHLLPRKAQLLLENQNLHPDLIFFKTLIVPHVAGLPPGTETASEIPIFLTHLLATAMDLTRDQVKEALQYLKPDFVFFDFAHWVPEICRKLGVKSICFSVVSAASIAIALVPARKVSKEKQITEEELRDLPEGYPSTSIVLHSHELRSLLFISFPFGDGISFYERTTTAMRESDAISIRTCEEVEGDLCKYIGNQYQRRVLLTGPVLPEPKESNLEEKWEKWLSTFKRKSVIFCAFGSQHILEKNQFQELLLGFEQSGFPFFIALKPPIGCDSVEEAYPEGFEERVRERGIVSGGWVQQPLILQHPSIGCFVNHCGFGSMWESLMSDCQIVLVPHLGDQILNTRLLADELKLAKEVERDENGYFSKEGLSEAIKAVMSEGDEFCETLKRNHEKWRSLLRKEGFMSGYIDEFMKKLQQICLQPNEEEEEDEEESDR